MSGVQLHVTQKNDTQCHVLQTQLPFTSLPVITLPVFSSLALLGHRINVRVCVCTKGVRLLLDLCLSLWVLSAVVAIHGCLTFTSIFFTHKSGLLCTVSQLIHKRTDTILTSKTYYPR